MTSIVIVNSIKPTFPAHARRCLLLAVVSLLASVCFSQSRVECIGFLRYSLNPTTKTAVLVGMKDKSYDGGENGIVIPDKVKGNDGKKYEVVALGDSCFQSSNVKTVTVPSSVTSLGASCFRDCTSLKEVSLPNVKSLGECCFYYCLKLATISLPSAMSLGYKCFASCDGLTSIVLPKAIYLGNNCFNNCRYLTYIGLSYTLTSIGQECFKRCLSLKQITIPRNVIYLGGGCFRECEELEKIVFQGKCPQLGNPKFSKYFSLGRKVPCFVPQAYFQDYKDALGKKYEIRSSREEKLRKFFGK